MKQSVSCMSIRYQRVGDYYILTLEKLDEVLSGLNGNAADIRSSMKSKESRMKTIANIEHAVGVCQQYGGIHDKYVKIGWKSRQKKFAEEHRAELSAYNKADRYLRKQNLDVSVNLKPLRSEYKKLEAVLEKQKAELDAVQTELQPLKDVRYCVSKVMEPQTTEKKEEPKHSVRERLADAGEQNKAGQPERTQQKKHNMDI